MGGVFFCVWALVWRDGVAMDGGGEDGMGDVGWAYD